MKDALTVKLSRHHFLIENADKDMGIKQVFEQMYHNDFNVKGSQIGKIDDNFEQLSKNEKIFLEVLDAGTRKNGNHYKAPLLVKQKSIKVPNNRNFKKDTSVKEKVKKDNFCFQNYQCFIDNNLVAKGYSRKANSALTEKSTWYLPHHGVYRLCKPDKIRVVFNCSAEFHNNLLNKELLPRPYLTSELVGVLARFNTEEVASMADIEAMFYQVHILKRKEAFLGTYGVRKPI